MNKIVITENIKDAIKHELNVSNAMLKQLENEQYQGGFLRYSIDLVSINNKEAKTPDINIIDILLGYGVKL